MQFGGREIVVVQLLSHVRYFAAPWTSWSRLPVLCYLLELCSNSCPLSRWCHLTISSSVVLLRSSVFPNIGVFSNESGLHISGQSIRASVSASVLPMNIQDNPLGLTGLISLLFKGLSRVFCSTTIWKHHFFGAQPSLWSSSHIPTWLLEEP